MNPDGQWEVAILETSYQIVTVIVHVLSQKNNQRCQNFTIKNSNGILLSLKDTLQAINTFIQERHDHSENSITVKVSRRTRRVKVTFQMKGLVLDSLVWTWEVMMATNFELF